MIIRKLLLVSLFFTACWAMALAQSVITFHGTVTDSDDLPQEDITVLAAAYYADSTVVMVTMTTNEYGQYTDSIMGPGQNIPGWLAISMVDCWGTTITQNFEIIIGNEDFTADFLYCEDFQMDSCLVIILEEWNPGNELELVAWSPIGQNATYLWSTGDSTESIFPQTSGLYCVTATFPGGCTWEDCVNVDLDSVDLCFVYVTTTQENDSTYTLEAVHSGNGPIEYFWSTGEQTQSINVGPGTYCISAFDADGCGDTTCVIVDNFDFCSVSIWLDANDGLVAEALGEAPLEYVWSTGENTQIIYPVQNGLYCVTTTDGNGCTAAACYQYYPAPDSCYVYINPVTIDSNTFGLQANGYIGSAPFQYEWSTGETTQIITSIDPSETYCVTMTDAEGCESSSCYSLSNFCYSYMDVNYVDTATAILTVWVDSVFQMPGAPQPEYLWSTGQTGPEVTVVETGEYCVTVTIGDDCVNESCMYVDFDSIGVNCSVWAYTYIDSSGNWIAEASPYGFGDFEYLWTNGETTQSILLDFPQEYACVTVTSSFGCEAVACVDSLIDICGGYISVIYQNDVAFLNANVWSLEDGIELLWSTGETGYTIMTEEEGTYCVTMTTANCQYTACVDVVFWNSDSCGVWVSSELEPSWVEYSANAFGTQPFSYLWSTGDTTQSVIIDIGDPSPCVTITDGVGCVSSACGYPVDTCNVSIYYSDEPVPSLHIESFDPVIMVIWSTGDTAEWLEIPGPGEYCADVFTISGCFASLCYTVDSIPPGFQNIVEGIVYGDSIVFAEGWVNIYAYDPDSEGPFVVVDSVPISPNGHYVSSVLPDGLYLAHAVLNPGSDGADDYFPGYHFTGTTWQEATPIELPVVPTSHYIYLIPVDDGFNGSGVIAGFVTDGQNIIAGGDPEVRGSGEGLPGVEIILKDAQGLPLAYAWSIEEGGYKFENLPFGTYRVTYEVAGLTAQDVWVTLTPNNPENNQVNLEVEGGTVAVVDPVVEQITLYPNPAKLEVIIPMAGPNTKFEMQVVDMQGKVVKAGSVINNNGVINIDVRAFSPGLYHIQLNSDRVVYYGRFIKQD